MAQGIAKYDSTCKKCSGPIKAGITKITWAPALKGSGCHRDCYFDSAVHKRDENGVRVDGLGGEPIPEPTPKPETEVVKAESTAKELPPQTAKIAASTTGTADIYTMIANGVLPIIESKLNTKVDAVEVKKIAENAVLDCAGILREEFTTKIVIEDKKSGEIKELKGLQHKQFKALLALVQAGVNVFLYDSSKPEKLGGPGAGKTTAAQQVAEALSKQFFHISLNIQSQPSLIMGYKTANGEYVRTDFRNWFENGGVFLFDELDNANGNFLTSLNTALANGTCSFPDGIINRHAEAVCIAAGNTAGTGANALHSSRQLLDAASRERFVFLGWEYDEKLERKVAIAHNSEAEPWVSYIQHTRKTVARLGVKMVCSPRASITGAQLLKTKEFTPEQVADMVLFKGCDTDTRSKVLANSSLPTIN